MFIGSFVSSVVYADSVYNQDYCWINILNFVRIVLHLSSQFCAIQSCFIFSKVVCNITKQLKGLASNLDNHGRAGQNANTVKYKLDLVIKNSDGQTSQALEHVQESILLAPEGIDRDRYDQLKEIDKNFII